MDNWVSFGTNRGAVLVGEYKKVIWYINCNNKHSLFIRVNDEGMFPSDKGLTHEMSAFEILTVANLLYQLINNTKLPQNEVCLTKWNTDPFVLGLLPKNFMWPFSPLCQGVLCNAAMDKGK